MLVYWRVTQCTTFHPLLISFDGVLIQHLARSICQARPLILGMDLIDLYVFLFEIWGGLPRIGTVHSSRSSRSSSKVTLLDDEIHPDVYNWFFVFISFFG